MQSEAKKPHGELLPSATKCVAEDRLRSRHHPTIYTRITPAQSKKLCRNERQKGEKGKINSLRYIFVATTAKSTPTSSIRSLPKLLN